MNPRTLRRLLVLVLAALPFVAWFSMQYDRYAIDGDAVAYMDIADLIHAHMWAGVVNAYWHPLYPALLLLGQIAFHTTRMTELGAYYKINFLLFLLQAVAVLAFATAVCRLRDRMSLPGSSAGQPVPDTRGFPASKTAYLFSADGLRLLGIALLVFASQRELTLGKVRPDGLLQALLLFGFAGMLALCAETAGPATVNGTTQGTVQRTASPWVPRLRVQLGYAALMGLSFGLAYLAKSFALLVALLSIAAVVTFLWMGLKQRLSRSILPGLMALAVFFTWAAPWVAALSHQKHRLDFGDSGSLNYAWYVAGTEKFHLEPWQASRFGSSEIHLVHPERQLLAQPGIYSYKALPWGTLPPWFDASFFNERVVTHLRAAQLARRDARNVILVFRYLLNHPEAWILLGLLFTFGARLRSPRQPGSGTGQRGSGTGQWGSRLRAFWVLPVALGCAIWAIYGIVNVEERYVTAGYLTLLLPLFAALQDPRADTGMAAYSPARQEVGMIRTGSENAADLPILPAAATFAVALLVLLSLGESVRIAAENRRELSLAHTVPAWREAGIYGVAEPLQRMGLRPGDEIACVGTIACVYDPYWMRLAQVRTTTELFFDDDHIADDLANLPDRNGVYRVLQREGARVLVGHFDPSRMTGPVAAGWVRLGSTNYFALPLNLPSAKIGTEP